MGVCCGIFYFIAMEYLAIAVSVPVVNVNDGLYSNTDPTTDMSMWMLRFI